MMKLSALSFCALSTILVMGCAHTRPEVARKPNVALKELIETVEVEDFSGRKTGEDIHELAEADADDIVIKREVGESNIDEELPDSEPNTIPYNKNFLQLKKTKRMQFWVDYFTKRQRDRFQRFINNGEEYRHIIEKVFAEHGLPKELYFVGLIESGYYLGARSHASAVGPWQFIKGTGSRYGLKISSEIDERQDLFKASRAAAMYFKDLNNVFSSWELALSAYNAGEYGILRRIMKHGTRDYYELSRNKQLPSETINYVPKVLAAMHVWKNAKKYGFTIPKNKHRLFDLTELKPIKKNTSLTSIARRLNVDVTLLRKLNPELKQNKTPRRFAGTYYLRIPKSKYSYKLESLEAIPGVERPESRRELTRRIASKENKKADYHVVKRGETLLTISKKYNIKAGKLAIVNGFKTWRTRVRVGQRLKLLSSDGRVAKAQNKKVKVVGKPIVYKVSRGDNLTEIARIFKLTVSQIKKANKLRSGRIMVGQKIVLPKTQKAIYIVKRGDHLTKVANDFNQPLEALIKLNALNRKTIYPGQKLIVNMD
jgi:membrane-bound lytic murein transglycosylase D